jgi:hypothetical protein
MRQKLPGAAGILACDQLRTAKSLQRPRRHVTEIPDGGGDDAQSDFAFFFHKKSTGFQPTG